MANGYFNGGINRIGSADIDWDAHDIRVTLIDLDAYTPALATHVFYSAVPVAARIATATMVNRTVGIAGVGALDADDVVFPSVPALAGNAAAEALIYWRFVTADTDSPLIALVDTAPGLPVIPNGGDIRVSFAPEGVLAI